MAQDTTFTSGEWHIIHFDGMTTGEIAVDGHGHHRSIARVSLARAEWRANANLIAAAPDLYTACQAWDQGFTDGEDFTPEQFLAWVNKNRRLARAALAKVNANV